MSRFWWFLIVRHAGQGDYVAYVSRVFEVTKHVNNNNSHSSPRLRPPAYSAPLNDVFKSMSRFSKFPFPRSSPCKDKKRPETIRI